MGSLWTKEIIIDFEDTLYKVTVKRYSPLGYISDNISTCPNIKKQIINNSPKIQKIFDDLDFKCMGFRDMDKEDLFYFEDDKKNKLDDINYSNTTNYGKYRLNMRI